MHPLPPLLLLLALPLVAPPLVAPAFGAGLPGTPNDGVLARGNDDGYRGAIATGIGDVNGDGFAEIALASFSEGKVWVFECKKGKLAYRLDGKRGYGWSVAGAGDTNQDGTADLVVGSPDTDTVYVYKGRNGKELAEIEGKKGSRFGWAVAGAGDTNGDGFSAIVVAARGDGPGGDTPGYAHVYEVKSGDLLLDLTAGVPAPCEVYGVAGLGDVNEDGMADVAVSFPFEEAGMVRVYSGHDGRELHTFRGKEPFAGFGIDVAGAGDVDADGFQDVIVGAPYAGGGVGEAIVFSVKSGKELFRLRGEDFGERFGYAVAAAGDPNLDGRGDVLIGAPGAPRDLETGPLGVLLARRDEDAVERLARRGRVVLASGRGGDVLQELEGPADGDWFGVEVDGIGDANGDGRSDFVVALDLEEEDGDRKTEAIVYSGKDDDGVLQRFVDGKAAER